MAEIRKNILSGEYVCISEARRLRPLALFGDKARKCPFCLENKAMTPENIYESESGRVRAFFNLYPILDYSDIKGYGRHEVVVDTDKHDEKFHDFSTQDAKAALTVLFARLLTFYDDPKIKYVQIFKNEGQNAGATIEHSHWQILGMPFLPAYQQTAMKNAAEIYEINRQCAICDAYEYKQLMVAENAAAFAYCPPEPRFGGEIHITIKRHECDTHAVTPAELADIASLLVKCTKTVYATVSRNYNICFQNLVNYDGKVHFYIQIIPRLGRFGGFELATSSYTHSEYPEQSAAAYRKVIAKDDELV